jgi:hypothetical protein
MAGEIPLEAVYGRRLALLEPDRAAIDALGRKYVASALPHARELFAALHALGKRTCIVTGGIRQAVFALAAHLERARRRRVRRRRLPPREERLLRRIRRGFAARAQPGQARGRAPLSPRPTARAASRWSATERPISRPRPLHAASSPSEASSRDPRCSRARS